MTQDELRTILHDWITDVLITEKGYTGLKIIKSHQNAPAPKNTYITIGFAPNRSRFGRATKGEANDDNVRQIISDWVLNLELREVHGDGSLLAILLDSLDREDMYHKHFTANNISHFNSTDITPVPRLNLESWVQEAMVEMQLGIAEETSETIIAIESVEYTGNIGGE